MQKLTCKLLIVILSLIVIDVAVGFAHRWMLTTTIPDASLMQTNLHNALFKKEGDVIFFGPSTTMHNFVCSMIKEQTGLSAYNCGFDGRDVLYSKACLESMLERKIPKMVVLDVTSNYLDGSWHYKIPETFCYYGISQPMTQVIDTLTNTNLNARMKLCSSLYRNNCVVQWWLRAKLSKDIASDGYIPLPYKDNHLVYDSRIHDEPFKMHPNNRNALIHIVSLCQSHGVKLLLVNSPKLFQTSPSFKHIIKDFCQQKNIEFADFDDDHDFSEHPDNFQDMVHMNEKGAKIFTQKIINQYLNAF